METSSPQDFEAIAETLKQKIQDVEKALQEKDPQIKQYCALIHAQLLECPELVYILPPESIGTYVKTLSSMAQIELISAKTKKSSTSKSLKNVTLDDL